MGGSLSHNYDAKDKIVNFVNGLVAKAVNRMVSEGQVEVRFPKWGEPERVEFIARLQINPLVNKGFYDLVSGVRNGKNVVVLYRVGEYADTKTYYSSSFPARLPRLAAAHMLIVETKGRTQVFHDIVRCF